jgi:glycosyltransferase involved in cell wall biosynthesis
VETKVLCEIIVPCFNEASSLNVLIKKCEEITNSCNIRFIFIDNGSTDTTWEIMCANPFSSEKIKFERLNQNLGYGGGLLSGLRLTEAPYVGWIHADLQVDPSIFIEVISKIPVNNLTPILIKGKRRNRNLVDTLVSMGMSIFESILFTKLIHEVNAQPTIFSRELKNFMKNPPEDFMLDLYVYVLALRNNYNIQRWSVNFNQRFGGVSSWNNGFSSKLKFISRTLRFSFSLRLSKA